jgi:hypothetical protein
VTAESSSSLEARPSGRQDSNLRPLVPQTSSHFPPRAEFDLAWFCGELVGMTTRPGALESIGIPPTHTRAYCLLLPSPSALDFGAFCAAVGRVEHLKPLDLVTGRWRARRCSFSNCPTRS